MSIQGPFADFQAAILIPGSPALKKNFRGVGVHRVVELVIEFHAQKFLICPAFLSFIRPLDLTSTELFVFNFQ